MEEQYEERKRKETEKEAEIQYKAQKAERRRRQFREDMKAALASGQKTVNERPDVQSVEKANDGEDGEVHETAAPSQPTVDDRPVEEQLKEAEAEKAEGANEPGTSRRRAKLWHADARY